MAEALSQATLHVRRQNRALHPTFLQFSWAFTLKYLPEKSHLTSAQSQQPGSLRMPSTLCSCPNPPTEHFESKGQLSLSTLPGSVTDYAAAASFSTTWRNVTMVSAVLYSHCITFLFWGLVWFGLVSFTHGVSLHSCWCVQLWRMLVSKLLCSDVLSREINARGTCSTLLSCLPLSHCPYFMPKPLSSPN